MIILDVWGGPKSTDHVARYILAVEDAFNLARQELSNGFLVNLRHEHAWGEYQNFDKRLQ